MKFLHPKQRLDSKTIVTIGAFDGVHQGHKQIFYNVNSIAEKNNFPSVMVTFEPPPKRFFSMGDIQNLTTLTEKVEILNQIGVDYLLVLPFNRALVNTPYDEFVKDLLINRLNAHTLVFGEDFKMGKDRGGDIEALSQIDVTTLMIPTLKIEDEYVKSTAIRHFVKIGEIEKANTFLGYNYQISGKVKKGHGLGKQLGFATANLDVAPEKLLPGNGIYAIKSIDNRWGLLYIGVRPTFEGLERSVEVHYIDYSGNLLNKKLSVRILKKLRNEQKFSSKEELMYQMSLDKRRLIRLIQSDN